MSWFIELFFDSGCSWPSASSGSATVSALSETLDSYSFIDELAVRTSPKYRTTRMPGPAIMFGDSDAVLNDAGQAAFTHAQGIPAAAAQL